MAEAKEGIANTDDYISKAHGLEITALENLPVRPVSSESSNSSSEYSMTEKEAEEEVNDKDEGLGMDVEQPSHVIEPKNTSLPPGPRRQKQLMHFVFYIHCNYSKTYLLSLAVKV